MSQWSRRELDDAFEHQQRVVAEIGQSWDWSRYEHAMGNLSGRESIRNWIVSTMNMYPGSEMPVYPVSWRSIDTEKGWAISEIMNRMRDPGDGGIRQNDARVFAKNMSWELP
jgi:hypothetical protein